MPVACARRRGLAQWGVMEATANAAQTALRENSVADVAASAGNDRHLECLGWCSRPVPPDRVADGASAARLAMRYGKIGKKADDWAAGRERQVVDSGHPTSRMDRSADRVVSIYRACKRAGCATGNETLARIRGNRDAKLPELP